MIKVENSHNFDLKLQIYESYLSLLDQLSLSPDQPAISSTVTLIQNWLTSESELQGFNFLRRRVRYDRKVDYDKKVDSFIKKTEVYLKLLELFENEDLNEN